MPAGFGGFDALDVDDGGRWAGVTTDTLAIGHDQGVVDLLEYQAVAKGCEPAIDSRPRRKIRW